MDALPTVLLMLNLQRLDKALDCTGNQWVGLARCGADRQALDNWLLLNTIQ